jgi:type IV pilus assembly protein PilY1
VVCVAAAGEPFAPATFYTWSGDPMAPGSAFTRVRIMDAAGFERPASRTDCTLRGGGAWCSQADEYRNFANWFVYHRTRLHAAIAATSEVLTRQESMLRLGYGRVGQVRATAIDGAAATTLVRGVRPWSGAYRAEAFDWLHRLRPAGDTAPWTTSGVTTKGPWHRTPDRRGPTRLGWASPRAIRRAGAAITCW